MFRLGLAFLIAFLAGGSVRAASPDPKQLAVPPAELAKARELVRLLGSEDYTEREDAQKSLAKMGRLARPVLVEAAFTNPNAEVRSRAARLLPRAEAEELKARLDTFLADEDLQYEHDLPGWAEFRIAAGTEWRLFGTPLWRDMDTLKVARAVYIELLDDPANRDLIYAIGSAPTVLGPAVGARKAELYSIRLPGRPGINQARRVITAPDVIALIFAESQVPSRYIPTTRVVSINVLLSPVNISGFDGRPAVFRNVVAYWMESRDDSASQYQALLAASSLNMPGPGTRVALKLLADPKAMPMNRAQAIVNLVRFDARDALPALERAMNDPTVVSSAIVAVNVAQPYDPIQIRDVALAAALIMNRQRPEDFGFIARTGYYNGGTTMTSYMQWALPGGSWSATFTRRAMALAKWAEWRSENSEKGKM